MNHIRQRLLGLTGVLMLVIVGLLGVASTVQGQRQGAPPFGIPVPGPVTLFTAPLAVGGEGGARVLCIVVNIGAELTTFEIRLYNETALVSTTQKTLAEGISGTLFGPPSLVTRLRCEFSYIGFPDDARATIMSPGSAALDAR